VRRLPVYLLAPAIDVPVVHLPLRAPARAGAVGSGDACAGEVVSPFAFLVRVAFALFAFVGFVIALAFLQSFLERRIR
jgi:hypothetical protein